MRFFDNNSDREISLLEIYSDWKELRKENSGLFEDEKENFMIYFHNIMEDTLKGRNDCDFIQIRPKEVIGISKRILKKIL